MGEEGAASGGTVSNGPPKAVSNPTGGTEAVAPAAAPPPGHRHVHHPHIELKFLEELKHRNVVRVALLYLVVCWLILEPIHVVFHMLEVPVWANRLVLILMAIGFPALLVFAWAFEITPEGLKPTVEVDPRKSIRPLTGQRLDRAIMVVMALAISYFVADKFWLSKRLDGAQSAQAPTKGAAASIAAAAGGGPTIAANGRSIAVLPFADMSERHDQQYFSDGLSEELIDLLAKLPQLQVIARTSSFSFKGKSDDIPTIGRKLNVANILEGSVRKSGNRLRVTTQLIRADSGVHIWSDTYDRELKDVFKVQDEIGGAVVAALKVHLVASQSTTNLYRTANSDAHDHYLRGERYIVLGGDTYQRAAEEFRSAIALDPKYAIAYAKLADAEGLVADAAGDAAMMRIAVADANKAIAVAPELAEAYSVRGSIRAGSLWDWSGAQADLEEARRLDPNGASTQRLNASLLEAQGRLPEAVEVARKMVDADPLSSTAWERLAFYQMDSGDLDGSRRSLNHALELEPDFAFAFFLLGITEVLSGRNNEGLESFNRLTYRPGRLFGIALAEQALGHRQESQKALDELIVENAQGNAYQIAEIYAFRGDNDESLKWLERAYAQHDGGMSSMNLDPLLRNLRGDSRFKALLVKMRFPNS
jgi:adenylate cyclase